LGSDTTAQLDVRSEVVSELAAIRRAAQELKGPTQHAQLDRDLSRFLDDVAQAQAAVERTPPNYYLAGRLAGNCAACHRVSK
jgi:hypothetical protein